MCLNLSHSRCGEQFDAVLGAVSSISQHQSDGSLPSMRTFEKDEVTQERQVEFVGHMLGIVSAWHTTAGEDSFESEKRLEIVSTL